jgi:peptidoglycan/LPS O-acetylase OafA/YrhL
MRQGDKAPAPLPERFLFVDGLRGVAAFWVVLFHAKIHIPLLMAALPPLVAHALFREGENGVAIFFALSGFVIAHSVRDADPDAAYLGRFALRRSIRLDPPYWASMALVLGFALLSARIKHEAFALPDAGTVAAHMLYLQELLRIPAISTVYWTLTYEVQFYLVLILAMIAARRAGPIVWAILFVIAALWGSGLLQHNLHPGLFTSHWYGFFLGVLAYRAHHSRTVTIAFWTLAAIVLAGALWRENMFAAVCALTAVALRWTTATGRLGGWLGWRWLQVLGLVSYSLYLTHNSITGAAFFLWKRVAGRRTGRRGFRPRRHGAAVRGRRGTVLVGLRAHLAQAGAPGAAQPASG